VCGDPAQRVLKLIMQSSGTMSCKL